VELSPYDLTKARIIFVNSDKRCTAVLAFKERNPLQRFNANTVQRELGVC
jgi:hypothetical protein